MAEHHHGDMDITTQEKTFAGFTRAVAYVIVVVVAILLFLTTRI
jgi:hypothetical protein